MTTDRRAAHRQGAVFLLTVYATALTLLVLNAVSLQRTAHELRISQMARDGQQAFWLAEAGLDHAVEAIRTAPMNVSAPLSTLTLHNGTAQVQVAQSLTAPTWTQPIPQFVYQVTAIGQATDSSDTATLHATVLTDATMTGAWANGTFRSIAGAWGPEDEDHPIAHTGDVRAAKGIAATVTVGDGTTIRGNVWVGPRCTAPCVGYDYLRGSTDVAHDGVYLKHDNWDELPDGRVTGTIASTPMPMARTPLPEVPQWCRQGTLDSISVADTELLVVKDGDPLDRSPAGDGRILICVDNVELLPEAKLTFRNPTMMYISHGISNNGTISVAIGTRPDDRGLTILSDQRLASTRPEETVEFGRIEGSIYAPQCDILLHPTWADPFSDMGGYEMQPHVRYLGYLVANNIRIDGVNASAHVPGAGESSSMPQVITWYAD